MRQKILNSAGIGLFPCELLKAQWPQQKRGVCKQVEEELFFLMCCQQFSSCKGRETSAESQLR